MKKYCRVVPLGLPLPLPFFSGRGFGVASSGKARAEVAVNHPVGDAQPRVGAATEATHFIADLRSVTFDGHTRPRAISAPATAHPRPLRPRTSGSVALNAWAARRRDQPSQFVSGHGEPK